MSEINSRVFKALIKDYLTKLGICFGIILLLFIGCRALVLWVKPIWYGDEALYYILNILDDRPVGWCAFFLLVCSIMCTVFEFRKVAAGIMEITNAVNLVYKDQDEEFVLPWKLDFMEGQLRQIQYDARVNKQALNESNQRKNDMIMYMAHDLKTPLTSVIGYLSLLKEENNLSEETQKKYIDIVFGKALRLEELINGFFEITRYSFAHMVLEKTTVNMSVMLSQMVVEFIPKFKTKGLNYALEAGKDIMVICDVDKMERVLDNLINNIANYSYENSEIELKLEPYGNNGMKLCTRNRGKHIPSEMQEHIFDQFFRMDSSRESGNGGTGLGLAISREIVNLHGGTIKCKSLEEVIDFEVILPGI